MAIISLNKQTHLFMYCIVYVLYWYWFIFVVYEAQHMIIDHMQLNKTPQLCNTTLIKV